MEKFKFLSVEHNNALGNLIKQALVSVPTLELAWETTTVAQALGVLREATPAVIILDIHLPDMCGLDAIPLMLERAPQAKVILLTDEDDVRYQRAAESNGVHACLRKDFIATALVMSIKRVLGTRFAQNQGDDMHFMKERM